MIDLNERCPICGSSIEFYINSYGALVEKCSACGKIIGNNIITTNKTTVIKGNYSTNTNDDRQLKDYESITINGVKFKKVEE